MQLPYWVFFIENIVFWSVVIFIAVRRDKTPSWVFWVLSALLVWFAIRIIMSFSEMDRFLTLNLINQTILLGLFYYLRKD